MSSWTAEELGGADLGDERLNRRLLRLVEALSAQPGASVPQAMGDWAATKGAYRFWDRDSVTAAAILAPHQAQSVARAAGQERVIVVQDTTDLDFSAHPNTDGLGALDNQWVQGLKVHSALLVSLLGVPLGLIHQQVWARSGPVEKHRRQRATAGKESQRWLDTLTASQGRVPPELGLITVADREADIYDLFALPRRAGSDLLIRAAHDRAVSEAEGYVQKAIGAAPLAGTVRVTMPRHDDAPAREVELQVRFATLHWLPPSHHKRRSKMQPIAVQVVLATEEPAPTKTKPKTKPIHWLLVTTLPVTTLAEAIQIVNWYTLRWVIERFHYVLKSGCHIQQLQLETAARLQRALATYDLVAWRLLWLTYQARVQADQPASAHFAPEEIQVLTQVRQLPKLQTAQPLTLQQAVRRIAQLGGFLARKADGQPGVKTIWRGLQRLSDLLDGWRAALSNPAPDASQSYG
jgi:hypothetical protein